LTFLFYEQLLTASTLFVCEKKTLFLTLKTLASNVQNERGLVTSVVWIMSAIICFPPLAGWSRPQPVVDGQPLCVLSEEPGYVLYSIVGSFYLPLGVMAVVYAKIYLAARWRARRHLKGAGGRRPGCVEMQPTASQRPPSGDRCAPRVMSAEEASAPPSVEAGVFKLVRRISPATSPRSRSWPRFHVLTSLKMQRQLSYCSAIKTRRVGCDLRCSPAKKLRRRRQ